MKSVISRLLMIISAMIFVGTAHGVIDSYEFSTPEQERRFFELTHELRCPKCQNQSIADSNAPIAQDLRREVHRLVNNGAGHQAVIDYMLARYGDFVLYKPRLLGMNLILWLGPVLLLLIGFTVLITVVRRHRVLASEMVVDGSEEHLTPQQQDYLSRRLTRVSSNEKPEGNKPEGNKPEGNKPEGNKRGGKTS